MQPDAEHCLLEAGSPLSAVLQQQQLLLVVTLEGLCFGITRRLQALDALLPLDRGPLLLALQALHACHVARCPCISHQPRAMPLQRKLLN
jgi:hypothetical protein